MKVGIITIYDAFNYGSYLQAYAMQNVLKNLGHQVNILNCSKERYRIIKRIVAKRPSRLIMNLQRNFAYSKAWQELNIKKQNYEHFDAIIIGSDEVWNIKNSSFEHWPEYFGYNLNTDKCIAYAPSCGYTTVDELLADKFCTNGIKKLDAVLARDDVTKNVSEIIRGNECRRVVDPTLLYLDNWESEIKFLNPMLGDYLLYYSYNAKPLMLNYLKQFAKEKKLRLVVAGFKYKWCDRSLIVEPRQFLSLIKNAKYIATTTFHGSIFAVVFKKRFIGFYPNKNQKVYDFLKSIGLEKRVHTADMPYSEFKMILTEPIDYKHIHNKLKGEAKLSLELLLSELNKKNKQN
jgi:hypothetical protein